MKILFSIIIPVYNTEKYIRRALYSIINQKFDEYEIVIINDGSNDNSDQIIQEIIKANPAIKTTYIKQNNRGLSVARNVGLANAKGEYIIWLDSDDALKEDSLLSLKQLIITQPDVIINRIASFDEATETITECTYFFKTKNVLNRKNMVSILNKMRGFWYAAWCFVPNRNFLQNCNLSFQEGIYHEDELWSPLLISHANTFICNNHFYYLNTAMRKGSIITAKNIKKDFDKILICKELYIYNKKSSPLDCKIYINRRIFIIMYSVFLNIKKYTSTEKKELELAFNIALSEIYGKLIFIPKIIFYIRQLF